MFCVRCISYKTDKEEEHDTANFVVLTEPDKEADDTTAKVSCAASKYRNNLFLYIFSIFFLFETAKKYVCKYLVMLRSQ